METSLTVLWPTLVSPGCHQVAIRGFQCQKFGVKIQKLLILEELLQPLVLKVIGIGPPVSQVMRPQGPVMPCTPQTSKNLKKSNFGLWIRGFCPL